MPETPVWTKAAYPGTVAIACPEVIPYGYKIIEEKDLRPGDVIWDGPIVRADGSMPEPGEDASPSRTVRAEPDEHLTEQSESQVAAPDHHSPTTEVSLSGRAKSK
jgi:hypothetical protein